MIKRWVYKPIPEATKIETLSKGINVNKALAALLIQRDITNFREAKSFFRPSLDNLHDPFLMKDMDQAVERLARAVTNGEKILIYGDYDVDGTTAVALFYGFLEEIHPNIDFYIPDRYKEGYGISEAGIDWAIRHNVNLIISLDCGIKAHERVAQAGAAGIDTIVCDHHQPGDVLPPAYAVLDPKREDCPYPFKELSGCGVGFKLLQGYCCKNDLDPGMLNRYLDLLTVSIASDMVPVTGENRTLTFFGLKLLNKCPRPGLQALINLGKLKGEITISAIIFGIGPRINAAGRIAHATDAVQLLLSKTTEEAEELASGIDKNNIIRRDFDTAITSEALQMIESDGYLQDAKSTVLFNNTWHKGVVGIVASRCIEKYYRPTIILTESNNKATGSARSVSGFDVYKAISECAELLEQFGGHKYAAGLTLELDKVALFQQKFEEVVAGTITNDQLVPQISIDIVLQLEQLTLKCYNILKQMEPFGPGNTQPVFATGNLYAQRARILKEEHLRFYVRQDNTGPQFCAIGFGMAKFYDRIKNGPFRMAYTVEENNYKGSKTLQLMVKDIKSGENA